MSASVYGRPSPTVTSTTSGRTRSTRADASGPGGAWPTIWIGGPANAAAAPLEPIGSSSTTTTEMRRPANALCGRVVALGLKPNESFE